jgi:NDP-sugar pyrophosphorylase family protein
VTGCLIDRGCTIGEGARLARTNVGEGTTVGPKSHHEDAILGDEA